MVGLLAVNKPAGMTSHDVVFRIRQLTGEKTGHAGTLDPQATGLLFVLLGQGTKLASLFVGLPKKYRAAFRLGVQTDTEDIWGKVVSENPVPNFSLAELEKPLSTFAGTVKQRVPAFSAVKSEGRPLYKKARRGEMVKTPTREVTFFSLRILEWNRPEVSVEVFCSSGTYIRALARDFGEKLGCGAVMSALVRTEIGNLSLEGAVALDVLTGENWKSFVLDPQKILSVPALRLKSDGSKVRAGQPLYLTDLDGTDDFQKGQPVFVTDEKAELLAWGHLADSVDALKQNPRQPAVIYGRVLV